MSEEEKKAEERFAVGYRVVNPEAPANEPRRFEPINPEAQAKAERFFLRISEEALAGGR